MSYQEVIHSLTLAASLVIPGYVFWKGPRRRPNQAVALLGLAGVIFNGFSLAAQISQDAERSVELMRLAFLGAFLLLPLVIAFPGLLRVSATRRTHKAGVAAASLVATLFAIDALRGGFLTASDPVHGARGGTALALWTLIIGLAFLRFCWLLKIAYRDSPDPAHRNRVLYLALGAALFAAGGLLDLVFRLGVDLGLPFPLAPLGSLAFLGLLSVAVVRHRLMGIEVVIHRGVALSLSAALLGGLFVVSGELLEQAFAGTLPPDSPYPGMLAALLVAVLVGPLSGAMSAFVEAFVISEFRVAPGLRRFRRLPHMMAADDLEGLRRLQQELERAIQAMAERREESAEPPGHTDPADPAA